MTINNPPTQNQPTPELFNVIVGNPPYVNAKNSNFTQKEKDFYYLNFATAEYQLDTYILFLEKSINLLKDGGYLGFIIPNAWLGNVFVPKIRYFLLMNAEIKEIVELGNEVFEEANVDTVILIIKKCVPNPQHQTQIGHFVEQKYEYRHSIQQSIFLKNKGFVFDINLSDKNRIIVDKMLTNSTLVGDILEVSTGIKEYQVGKGKPAQTQMMKDELRFNAKFKKDETFVPELLGQHVEKYNLNWQRDTWLSYGTYLAEPRKPKFFEGERLIIREIPSKNSLIVAYTKEKFAVKNSAHIGLLNNPAFNLKFVVGVLNTRIVGWFFRFKNNEFDGLFPKIKIDQFKSLPIPNATPDQQVEIAVLVDRIMDLKAQYSKYLDNTFKLLDAELAGSIPVTATINRTKSLTKFTELDFTTFLTELTKQKYIITPAVKRNLLESFEIDKARLVDLQTQISVVDNEIEALVRGLYGVGESFEN